MIPSNIGSYPGRPLDLGARFSIGDEGAAFYVGAGFGARSTNPPVADTIGAYYLFGQPTVLSTFAAFVTGLVASGDVMTCQLTIDAVPVRDLLLAYDDGSPIVGGCFVSLVFEPLIVVPGQRVAVVWIAGDPAEVEPLATVGFLQ